MPPHPDAKEIEATEQVELPPLLDKGERGGLLAVPVRTNVGGALFEVAASGTYDDAIKLALLFVEKLDVPDNAGVSFSTDSIEHLIDLGLTRRSKVEFKSIVNIDEMLSYPWLAYLELEKREPGRWSIWQDKGQQIIPPDRLSPDLAFALDLRSAIIVPSALTPFEDVLLFKERHHDELISFRHHLEGLTIKISNEGDPRAAHIELERFDNSLADYLKKARESNIQKAVASITAEFDWTAAVRSMAGAGSGGLIAAAQGLSLTAAAAAMGGGVLAGLSLKSVAGLKEGPSPFRYIARIEKEYG